MKKAYLKIVPVGCVTDELAELDRLDSSHFQQLRRILAYWLQKKDAEPVFEAYCFGSLASPDAVKSAFGPSFSVVIGLWNPSERRIYAQFTRHHPISHVLLHEATHGLLQYLCPEYHFPLWVEEAYAKILEAGILGTARAVRGDACRGLWSESRCMSILEICSYHPARSNRAYYEFVALSYWLASYCTCTSGVSCKVLLRRLYSERPQSGPATITVLETLTHRCYDILDKEFRAFCTTGVVPGEGASKGS
jgi:hypothetical protein